MVDSVRIAERTRATNHAGVPLLAYSKARTPITVEAGPWSGFLVRRARKLVRCDDRCKGWIHGGMLYLEGEQHPYRAGGFGKERYCLKCAGPMVLHAVAAAEQK